VEFALFIHDITIMKMIVDSKVNLQVKLLSNPRAKTFDLVISEKN
jgi:hypothetical protein